MIQVSLAEAKARLSELVEFVASGDEVRITRRGKVIAQLTAASRPAKPIDVAAIRALTESMPRQAQSAGDFIRGLRDSDRY